MPYTFRVVFSGPCAYMPNILEGDDPEGKSWSVVLPSLRNGWPGEEDGDKIAADRHLAAVQFSEAEFHTSVPPDVRVAVRNADGGYRESGLYLLNGHRVTFDLPGVNKLQVVEHAIDRRVMASQIEVQKLIKGHSPLMKSMSWLPAMAWLYKDLRWFGNEGIDYFHNNGFPIQNAVAGHVLLKHGFLVAHEIDIVPKSDHSMVPTIWEFRPHKTSSDLKNPRQALAKSLALEAELEHRAVITVAVSPQQKKTLTLKAEYCTGEVEIYIKNREFEDIFLPNASEYEPRFVDLDFRYMYTHAKGYTPTNKDYPLPHLADGSDEPGDETATCGGHTFSGFSEDLRPIVEGW